MRLLFGEEVGRLEKISLLFGRRVPTFILSGLLRFLKRIELFLGISFFIKIPDTLAPLPPSVWKNIDILETLKEYGVVKMYFKDHLSAYPDEPRLKSWSVLLSDSKGHRGYSGYGYDFFSHQEALGPALGEAFERFSLNNFFPRENEMRTASYKELKKEGALNIFSVAGYSDELRKKKNLKENLLFNEETPFAWVKGKSLTNKKIVWIPYQLTSFAGQQNAQTTKEPLILKLISTGAAAHVTEKEAILNGLLEAIQRDAFMIYWLRKITPHTIDTKEISSEKLRRIEKDFKRYNLSFFCLYLKTDIPVHTVATIIIDKTGVGPAVCIGAATGFDFSEVVYKSILESFASRLGVRKLNDLYHRQEERKPLIAETLNHEERLVYWCPQERIKDIQFFIRGPVLKIKDLPTHNEKNSDSLEFLLEHFRKENTEVACTKLTLPTRFSPAPLVAVMITVPALQPLHLEEELPCFGGERLFSVPQALKLRTETDINTIPHPFP